MANLSLQQEFRQYIKTLKDYRFEGFHCYMDFEDFVIAYHMGAVEGVENNLWAALDTQQYVQLRYTERPAELYEAEGIKLNEEGLPHMPIPVCLIFDNRIAAQPGVVFSDGDSNIRGTIFYKSMEEAARSVDWRTVFMRTPYDPHENPRDRRIKAAELLYPERLPVDYVEYFVFRTEADRKNAAAIFGPDRRFVVAPKKFNCFKGFTKGPNETKNIFNYVLDYEMKVERGQRVEIIYRFANDDIKDFEHEFNITYSNGDQLIDDGGYYKYGVLWHWIGELDYDLPFTLTYRINGHRVIYARYGW